MYSKTCVKQTLKKDITKIIMKKNGSLMNVESFADFCRMLPLEHSAILKTYIKQNKFPVFLKVTVLHRFYCAANGAYHVTRRGCSLCHGMFTQIKLCFSSTIVK